MADPFSIFTGAASLADICYRTVKGIRQLQKDAGNIDIELTSLGDEVGGLKSICDTIRSSLDANGEVDEEYGEKADDPRVQMRRTLGAAQETVEKLDSIVQKISGPSTFSTLKRVDAYQKAVRKMFQENELQNCRVQLTTYQRTLHLFLTILTNKDMSELSDTFQKMCRDIKAHFHDLQESNKSATDFHYDAAALDALRTLREAIESAPAAMKRFSTNQHFDIPQPVRDFFTGRESELRELRECFLPTRKSPIRDNIQGQRRFVVFGLGGSGKTQFCSKFARDNQDSFWGVFWIDASTPDCLKQTLGIIAGIAGREKTESSALDWLSTLNTRWLLIIDNADDPNIPLERYFPKGNRGNILVTTRNPAYKVHGNVGPRSYDFGGLNSEDAIKLLLRASEEPKPWDRARQHLAEKINEKLGSLALAIIHAGAAIRGRLCSLHDYLAYYGRMLGRIRRNRIPEHLAIFATWEICYQRLEDEKTKTPTDAMEILNTFAFFHRESISEEILIRAITNAELETDAEKIQSNEHTETPSSEEHRFWPHQARRLRLAVLHFLVHNSSPPALPRVIRDGRQPGGALDAKDRIRLALKELTEMSLITFNRHNHTYSMHPIVHDWARERPQMTLADQALWADVAGSVLAASVRLPDVPGQTREDEKYHVSLLPHVEHVQSCRQDVAKRLSEKRDAERTLLSLFASLVPKIGPDAEKVRMCAKFATVYGVSGKWENAEALLRPVAEFLYQYFGPQHKRSRRVTESLSGMYWHLGRQEEAVKVQKDLVQTCQTHLGRSHPDTLRANGMLGRVYWQQGKITDARILQEAVLANMKKLLPDNHGDMLDLMDRLGSTHNKFWDFEKAYRLHSAAVKGMAKTHGPTHLRTLEAKENMCTAVVLLGGDALEAAPDLIKEVLDMREAAPDMMQEVLDARKVVLGKENPYTLLAMVNRAIVLAAAGRLDDAEALVQQGLPVAARTLGREYIGTLYGKQVLAGIWLEQGRHQEAEDLLLEVTESQKKIPSPRGHFHPDRLGSLIELARCSFMLGKIERAIDICDEAVGGFESIEAGKHPLVNKLRTARSAMLRLVECQSSVYEVDRRPERHEIVFPCLLFEKVEDGAKEMG